MESTKKQRLFSIMQHAIPYVFLVLAAFFSTYILFYDGLAGGDDIGFHMGQIYDIFYGMKNGHFGISPNHYFMGGFAIYNQSYYGPVSHYSAAIIAYLTSWAGGDVIFGYKATIFLSGILGAIFMYKLARKISKNYYISLISAFIFVFLPYRSFCALSRCAFSEAVAISFIPMIFYGIYAILYNQEFRVAPYVCLALGAAGIIMTHPSTALYTVVFALIFIFVHFKRILVKRNEKDFWIALSITTVLTVGLVLFYVISSVSTKSSGIYRLSDNEIMWSNLEHVSGDTLRSVDFSGFLNIGWIRNVELSDYWDGSTVTFLVFGFLMFVASIIVMFFVDHFAKKLPWWARFPIDLATLVVFPILMDGRVEQYLSLAVFYLAFVIFETVPMFKDCDNLEVAENKVFKDLNFYFFMSSFIVLLIFIFDSDIWEILPSFFYNIQFPWRLWGLAYFMLAGLVCVLLSDFKVKKIAFNYVMAATASLLCVTMSLVEKRIYLATAKDVGSVVVEDAGEFANKIHVSGAQNEMVPLCFELRYDDPNWSTTWSHHDYQPKYENSLYTKVRNALIFQSNFILDKETYYDPAVLEGTATIEITKYDCPDFAFNLEVTSENAYIQFPEFYADGYVAYFNGQEMKGENVDGLLAFRVEQGSGEFDIKFEGSTAYKVTRPIFYTSLGLVIAGGVVGLIYRKKWMKKDENSQLKVD